MKKRVLSSWCLLILLVLAGCSGSTPEEVHKKRLEAAIRSQQLLDELQVARSNSMRPGIFIMYPAKLIPDNPERDFNQKNYLNEVDTAGSVATAFSLSKKGLVATSSTCYR